MWEVWVVAFFFTEFVFSNNILGIVQRQQHDEWRQQLLHEYSLQLFGKSNRDEC